MTDIEKKALALANEVRLERGFAPLPNIYRTNYEIEALCRAIEQHEAFQQEVSDAVWDYYGGEHIPRTSMFAKFVTPKPDPLEEVLYGMWFSDPKEDAKALRAALETRGLEIREKNDDD